MSQTLSRKPRKAIVLAAGLGKRMLPITATMPKPLVKVAGRRLIDFALDKLHEAGVESVVVNVHHFADMLEAHGNDLRTVILMTVTLDSLSGWLRVMEALHSTQTMHLKLMGLTYADHEAEAGTTDLSMGSFADFRRSEGGVAYVGHKYVDVSGGNVKPALEFIIQHIEKCVKERVGLGQSET